MTNSTWDCPAFREHVVKNFPCFFRGMEHVCDGPLEPHHVPYKSANPRSWTDLEIIPLCGAGHREAHKHPGILDSMKVQAKKQQRCQTESFISALCDSGPPVVMAKRKTTTRKRLSDFKHYEKPF